MTAPALDLEHLRGLSEATLDDALRSFADAHGAQALPALSVLAGGSERALRRAAKRALYRLAQRGVTPPPRPSPQEFSRSAWICQ